MSEFGRDVTGSEAALNEFGRDVTPPWMQQQNAQAAGVPMGAPAPVVDSNYVPLPAAPMANSGFGVDVTPVWMQQQNNQIAAQQEQWRKENEAAEQQSRLARILSLYGR
jgi:hypothetical protein